MAKFFPQKFNFTWGLKYRIIVLFTLIAIIPTSIVGYVAYNRSAAYDQHFLQNYVHLSEQALNSKIDTLLAEAITFLNISSDNRTLAFLDSPNEQARLAAIRDLKKMFSEIRYMRISNQDIYDITIIGANGNCISERFGYFQLANDFHSYAVVQTIAADPLNVSIYGHREDLHPDATEADLETVSRGIVKENNLIGTIHVDIRKSAIRNLLVDLQGGLQGLVTIVDKKGLPVINGPLGGFDQATLADVLKMDIASGDMSLKIGSESFLIAYDTLPAVQWKLLVGIPRDSLLSSQEAIGNSILLALLLSFAIILAANTILSTHLARPISGLKTLMRQAAEGNFDTKREYKGQNEISELYDSFDKMAGQIKALMARSLEEQSRLKSFELKYLQAQVNPHFLYNTLESIVWVAESGKTDEVIDLIIALSRFYKSVLNIDSDIISMAMAVEHIENYLLIMKKRYYDILNYSIHVDERVLKASFPKVALQPIIENAINHGIKNNLNGGMIDIDIQLTPANMIEITVLDNGVGMDAGKLSALQNHLKKNIATDHQTLGLCNVNERIKLLFGKEYGLEISSQYRAGTKVRLIVPYVEMKGGDDYA